MDFSGERFIPEYDDPEMKDEHFIRYEFAKKLVGGKVVLDAACGEGYGSCILASIAKKVVGIDISKEAIENAKNKYKYDNLSYVCSSVGELPVEDKSVDVVVSFETIEHVPQEIQQAFLEEVSRVLKDDGLLIMSTPNKAIYSDKYNYKNEFHIKEFYAEEFKDYLESKFKYVEFYGQDYQVVNMISSSNKLDYKKDSFDVIKNCKYLLAICSNSSLEKLNVEGYLCLARKTNYYKLVDRILKLQKEVEERNEHIKYLDTEFAKTGKMLQDKVAENQTTDEKNIALENEVVRIEKMLQDKVAENQTIDEKKVALESEIAKIGKMLQDKVAENQTTDEKNIALESELTEIKKSLQDKIVENKACNDELDRIKKSTGYRFLLKAYNFRDSIFPFGSKRRFCAKLLKNAAHNPIAYMRALNFENLKKLYRYSNSLSGSELEHKLSVFDDRYNENKREHIVVNAVEANSGKKDYKKLVFKQETNPLVSIIIPVYNQFHYTYACLKSILENTTDVSYEIIIGDDCSNDETLNLCDYAENIKIVRNETNLRFLLNCNNAAKYARGKYIHFLNNDTQVQKGWMSSLVRLIESDEKIGMVGSKLVYPDGRLQEAGGILWKDGSAWNYGNCQDPNMPEYNYVKEADYISGASILIKADLWKEIGGFDERFVPAYCEDSDLAFEVRKHGFKVMYQPKSVVVHFEGVSNGTDTSTGLKHYQVVNSQKFYEKWKQVLKKEHFNNAENVFLARDRSNGKKCVVFVDHYVPTFDQDAGSKTVYQYIKLLCSIGCNVKFIGDNFADMEPYRSVFQEMGVEVLYGTYYADNWKHWIKENAKYIKAAFLNRPHIAVKYIDCFKENTKAKIVYYGHDLHFLRELREYKLNGNKQSLRNSQDWQKKELSLMRKADVVYYPSNEEIEEIKKLDDKVNVKAIPAYLYGKNTDTCYDVEKRNDVFFIGGFAHGPNVDAVKWLYSEILPILLKKGWKHRIYILGSHPPKEILDMNSENFIVKGFVSDEELSSFYQQCRMVIAPLRYGAGVKGKIVEAMYYKLPVLTTDIGAEGLDNTGVTFAIANDSENFASELINLYDDEDRLSDYSNKGYELLKKQFTESAILEIFNNDFLN